MVVEKDPSIAISMGPRIVDWVAARITAVSVYSSPRRRGPGVIWSAEVVDRQGRLLDARLVASGLSIEGACQWLAYSARQVLDEEQFERVCDLIEDAKARGKRFA